jgi:HSP20 family protein
MERLFDEPFYRPINGSVTAEGRAMLLDIYTTADSLVLEAALPGVKPEDVDVSILGDTLTLTAETSTERKVEEGGYQIQELQRGRFSRTVSLPSGLRTDAAAARFENGMLRLEIPKAEQAKPRQIPVTAVTEGEAHVPATEGAAPEAVSQPTAG